MPGGEWDAQFIHTFFNPPTDITWTRSLKREWTRLATNPFPSAPRSNLSKERILKHFVNPDHPVCASKERAPFIYGAATPPVSGGDFPTAPFQVNESPPSLSGGVRR